MECETSEYIGNEPATSPSSYFSGWIETGRNGVHIFGTVQRYDRRFFVKSLVPECRRLHWARLQLEKEFKLMLSLNLPGVVRAYELTEIPGAGLSIVMEYVSGMTFDRWLATRPSRKVRRAAAMSLLAAVEGLHAAGVVHRDLKPGNIMVDPVSGNVTVIDLGMGDSDAFALLKLPAGTRAYAAPEQMAEGYRARPSCDVYALGALLRRLDCGICWNVASRRALRLDPAHRPQDASALKALVARTRMRRLATAAAIGIMTVGVSVWLLLTGSSPSAVSIQPSAPVAVARDSVTSLRDSIATAGKAAGEPEVDKVENVETGNRPVQIEDNSALMLAVRQMDVSLEDMARRMLTEMEALDADTAISAEWRIASKARMLADIDKEYGRLSDQMIKEGVDADASKLEWKNLRSWKLREAMRENMAREPH